MSPGLEKLSVSACKINVDKPFESGADCGHALSAAVFSVNVVQPRTIGCHWKLWHFTAAKGQAAVRSSKLFELAGNVGWRAAVGKTEIVHKFDAGMNAATVVDSMKFVALAMMMFLDRVHVCNNRHTLLMPATIRSLTYAHTSYPLPNFVWSEYTRFPL